MRNVTVGLLGYGHIAEAVHGRVLRSLAHVDLVAIAEADPARRDLALARVPQARLFSSYEALLADPSIEAVVICLPPALHAPAALAAFDAGKHVYLEKPLAPVLSEADVILRAWRRTDRIGMMGFNYRFDPRLLATKAHLQAGRLGDIVAFRTVFASSPHRLPAWKTRRSAGGGVLLDLASHHLDLITFLADAEIHEVQAHLGTHRTEEDTAFVHLQLVDGITVQAFFSLTTVDDDRIEIFGSSGKLTLDRYRAAVPILTPAPYIYGRTAELARVRRSLAHALRRLVQQPGEPSFRRALQAFTDAVRNGSPVQPDLVDGYRCLRAIEAAETSARTGRAVPLTSLHEQ